MVEVTDDFQIEDLLFQSPQRIVYGARGADDTRCTITRLKYPGEILEKLSSTRFARALVELKNIQQPCIRPVIDGGLDPVDRSPWIANVAWSGESLDERLKEQQITPEVCARVENNARITMEALEEEAGILSFDPQDVVVTSAADGQLIESFIVDYFKWFYDWANSKKVGSRHDPEVELSNLLEILDPARKAMIKPQAAPVAGPVLIAPSAATAVSLPAKLAKKNPILQPAVSPRPQPTQSPAAAAQTPSTPPTPPISAPLALTEHASQDAMIPPPPVTTTPISSMPPKSVITGPLVAGSVIQTPPPVATTPLTPQPRITSTLASTLPNSGQLGTPSLIGSSAAGSQASLGAGQMSSGENPMRIIGLLACALVLLGGLAFWMVKRGEENSKPVSSAEKTEPPESSVAVRQPMRPPVVREEPDPVINAPTAKVVEETPTFNDTPGADTFTLKDEKIMRTMDGEVATMVAKVKQVKKHGKHTYLKFKLAKPQVAAGVDLSNATEGLDIDYLNTLEGKTIKIFGTVKIEGNHRLVVFFSKKSAIQVVADLPVEEEKAAPAPPVE